MGKEYGAYTCFAQVYDLFMDNVPYGEWADAIAGILREHGIADGCLLDLGCGTGRLTRLMKKRGYDMIGVDSSIEMLEIARGYDIAEEQEEWRDAPGPDGDGGGDDQILYLWQDMRELELYDTVRAVYSACDSINYILEEGELQEVFELVHQALEPQGIFIFDCNTAYKYEKLLAENTFAETRDEGSFIWENYYDAMSGTNQYDLTLYIAEPDGRFRRFEETHLQKHYATGTIRKLLKKAGMEVVGVYDAYTKLPPQKESERIMVVARDGGRREEGIVTKGRERSA